jgi:glycerophosphoryl diester phosphodiesterase
VAAAVAMATGMLVLGAPVPAPATAPVTVYAHRGGAGLAPENTLGAFRQAHAQFGADGVWLEMDTQLTADGHLVVLHDDTLDRTTNCAGPVIRRTLNDIAGCDASLAFPGWPTFERIPTLREVLLEGRDAGWRIMVEIKDIPGEANFDLLGTAVADKLVPLVRELGFPSNRLIVESFWPLALERMESLAPDIPTALLTSASLPGVPPPIGIPAAVNVATAALRNYEISAPASNSLDLTPELAPTVVATAHALGRQMVWYTLNTTAEIDFAISVGVDGIISDRPDLVFARLGP